MTLNNSVVVVMFRNRMIIMYYEIKKIVTLKVEADTRKEAIEQVKDNDRWREPPTVRWTGTKFFSAKKLKGT